MNPELQRIEDLCGRYKAIKEQLKDPTRASGAWTEYFEIQRELISMVPKLLRIIEAKDEIICSLKERLKLHPPICFSCGKPALDTDFLIHEVMYTINDHPFCFVCYREKMGDKF